MLKNLLNTFVSRAISAVCTFFLLILTTQFLGSYGRGLAALVTASVGINLLFNGFIGGTSLVYLIPQNKGRSFLRHVFRLAYFWAIFISLVVALLFYVSASVPRDLIIHVLFLSILASLSFANAFVLLAHEKILLFNMSNMLQVMVTFVGFGSVILVQKAASVDQFIICLYIAYTIGIVFTSFHVRRLWNRIEHTGQSGSLSATFKEIGRYGFISQLGNVIQYLNYRLSYYVLNHYIGPSDVGVYSVGIQLAEAVWMISGSISLVLYSRVANVGDTRYAREITIKLAKFSFFLVLICVLILCFVPKSFLALIFGSEFSEVRVIIRYLAIGITTFGFSAILSHYFAGTGRYHINTFAAFLGLIITVAGNFFLVPMIGYLGAALTASISYLIIATFLIIIFLIKTDVRAGALIPSIKDVRPVIESLRQKNSAKSTVTE